MRPEVVNKLLFFSLFEVAHFQHTPLFCQDKKRQLKIKYNDNTPKRKAAAQTIDSQTILKDSVK